MKYGDLLRTHPSLDLGLVARYDALYRGGAAFRARVREFLPRNPLEDGGTYALRLKASPYRSYVGPIVDFFAAQLFAAPFHVRARAGDEEAYASGPYADLKEDCDGAGTDLTAFMRERFVSALVKGWAWILAELPDDEGLPARDAAEYDQRALGRLTLRGLDAERVLDWEIGEGGTLRWAITYSLETARPDPRAGRGVVTETFRLYDRETVETYVVTWAAKSGKRPKATDELAPIGPAVPHRFPCVPLVCMAPPPGLWLVDRIADSQVNYFRLAAAQTWALERACYPLAVFTCADDAAAPETGSGYVVRIGTGEKLEYVQVPTGAFETLAKAMASEKDEIYRVAQQMAAGVDNNAAAIGRSGESKHADTKATETCLVTYGALVKEAIEAVYELASDARGDVDVAFSIEGLDRFDLDAIGKTLEALKGVDEFNIPSPTLKRELWRRAADLMLPSDASEDVKAAIRKEIDAAATPTTSPGGKPGTADDGRTLPAPGQGAEG